MVPESESTKVRPSTFAGDKNATQKYSGAHERISFRDLARFAFGKQYIAILASLTDADERTVKRWSAPRGRRTRAPDRAVMLALGEITRRYG